MELFDFNEFNLIQENFIKDIKFLLDQDENIVHVEESKTKTNKTPIYIKIILRIRQFLKTILSKIKTFYDKIKRYLTDRAQLILYGKRNVSKEGDTNQTKTSYMVPKDFDYNEGIKEMYVFLVPFVKGYDKFCQAMLIDVNKVSKYISQEGKSLDERTLPVHNRLKEALSFTETEAFSNKEYSNEKEINDYIRQIQIKFFGSHNKESEKVSVIEYKYNKPIETLESEWKQFESTIDRLRKYNEDTINKISDYIENFKTKLQADVPKPSSDDILSAVNISKFYKDKEETERQIHDQAAKSICTAFSALSIKACRASSQLSNIIGKITKIFSVAVYQQNQINIAIKIATKNKEYRPDILDHSNDTVIDLDKVPREEWDEEYRKELDEKRKQESEARQKQDEENRKNNISSSNSTALIKRESIEYLIEAFGNDYEYVLESTVKDRFIMLGRKLQILINKIIHFFDKAVLEFTTRVQSLLGISARFQLKTFKSTEYDSIKHGTDRAAATAWVPTKSIDKCIHGVLSNIEPVLNNIVNFASIDLHNQEALVKTADVTPLDMALHKTTHNTINELFDKVNVDITWKYTSAVTTEEWDALKYVSREQLQSSINFIKDSIKIYRRQLDSVLKSIVSASKQKDLSDEAYRYCTKVVTACAIGFNVINRGFRIMAQQYIKSNNFFLIMHSQKEASEEIKARYGDKWTNTTGESNTDKTKKEEPKKDEEENTTESKIYESYDYIMWIRQQRKRR